MSTHVIAKNDVIIGSIDDKDKLHRRLSSVKFLVYGSNVSVRSPANEQLDMCLQQVRAASIPNEFWAVTLLTRNIRIMKGTMCFIISEIENVGLFRVLAKAKIA